MDGRRGWHGSPGLPTTAIADAQRWYAVIPLPLPSADLRQVKPGDFRAESAAYDWASGREALRIPARRGQRLSPSPAWCFIRGRTAADGPDADRDGRGCTGQERWHRSGRDNHGIFAANSLLYTYDESLDDYGPGHDPAGEYLNALDPATGKSVQRFRFYPDYRPFSSLVR